MINKADLKLNRLIALFEFLLAELALSNVSIFSIRGYRNESISSKKVTFTLDYIPMGVYYCFVNKQRVNKVV
ncbi:transcriptional regulator [Bacillus subtilis BEST7003]|nr:YrzN [Bacillus subtilis subsp. subtilis 6051-HGW]AQZ91547.1 hypothetical protein B4U62_14330 [Bacillus subtilis]AXF33948.1 hypothetical protein DS740_14335 [Bacillus sp. DM2]MDR4254322.1 hypothetical protein [Bacillus subtilis subsp. subtilis NCIB 3610 = ATCC 6051 = DSM 10]MDR4278887.1 hypothetical protein [Bacillus subtilis KCTC 1028 = ATCC 6051a]QAT75624.1 hypothetical protein D9C22_14145 [Bacillus sp. WR11]QDW06374.1 hypothetical protein FFE90_014490 [Bacillus sp. KBS0812]RFB08320.1 hy